MSQSNFANIRRQKFLTEKYYHLNKTHLSNRILVSENEMDSLVEKGTLTTVRQQEIFDVRYKTLLLEYTSGATVGSLLPHYFELVNAMEQWTIAEREYNSYLESKYNEKMVDNETVFHFETEYEFQEALQIVSLGFLLGDGANLRRVVGMLDRYRGTDLIFEAVVEPAVDDPRDNDTFYHADPYDPLVDAICVAETDDQASEFVRKYVNDWYSAWKEAGWHNGHLRSNDAFMNYYGYWSFEAAAVSVLFGIDDASYRDNTVYPKDLADWARANNSLERVKPGAESNSAVYRCEGGKPCPRSGFWSTPAQENTRAYFQHGTVMPRLASDYGATIWQWDRDQTDPRL